MAKWTTETQPFGSNRAPLLTGLASDGTSGPIPVAVDPATGRLLVNSTGGAASSSVALNDGVSTSTLGTVAHLTNSNPLAVEIVDGSGNQITSFGGGTQYTDAGTPPANPIGPTLEFNNAGAWATVGSAHPLPVSLTSTTITGTVAVTESGTWNVGLSAGSNAIGSITNTSFAATQATGTNLHTVVDSGSVTATPAVTATIVNGQQTATTSAVALATNTLTQGITVQALSTNTVSVFVGASGVTTSTGIELPAGAAVTLPVSNSNVVFIRCASSSPVVSWIGA